MSCSSDASWTLSNFRPVTFSSFSSLSNGVASPTSAFSDSFRLLQKQLDEQVAKLHIRALFGTRVHGPCQGAGESFGFQEELWSDISLQSNMKCDVYICCTSPVVTERSVFTFEFDFASSDKGGVPAARPTSGFGMNSVRKWSVPSSHPR